MDILLATERLALREFTAADADLLVELDSDPEVVRYITGRPTPREEVETEVLPRILASYAAHPGFGVLAAHTLADGEFLGWFMFRPGRDRPAGHVELGYRLRRAAWGKGYATEGSLALVEYGFTRTATRRVYAEAMAVNTRSRRVMEKAGLTYDRTFHDPYWEHIEGNEHGEVRYVLDRETWAAARG